MASKPKRAEEYTSEQSQQVRATCLYVATRLGDLMDELLIVGGLVPSLIIDQENLEAGAEPHVGTMDLDVGLQVTLLDEERYSEVSARFRDAGFVPDRKPGGELIRQRWTLRENRHVTVDFLIGPTLASDVGGRLRNLEEDFAAIIIPGLQCAFRDRSQLTLKGSTVLGEKAERRVWVCDAGAYVVLKALAFDRRGEEKDAYDLYYVLRYYGLGVESVAERLRALLDDTNTQESLEILRRDFLDIDSVGPKRLAYFMRGAPDDDLQADVVGLVERLLNLVTDR